MTFLNLYQRIIGICRLFIKAIHCETAQPARFESIQ